MRRGILFLAAAVLSNLSLTSGAEARPSFDCNKASTAVEHSICGSDRLSDQDAKLAALYKKVLNNRPKDQQSKIKSGQRNWLKKRERSCTQRGDALEKCLSDQYRARHAELSSLLAFNSNESKATKEGLKILRITPSGNDVPAGRQVVFQFDRPVVPIGRMERDAKDIPIRITPKLNCEWRWLNTSALACQLRQEDQLKNATRYNVQVNPGIVTEDGTGLGQAMSHSFVTARPKATYARFVNWLTPGDPFIQITFNQPVTKQSVERTISLNPGWLGDKVRIVAHPDNLPRTKPYWLQYLNNSEQPTKVDDRKTEVKGDTARRVWIVEPTKELPLDTSIQLEVAPGLVSSEGDESGIEDRTIVSFDTYPEFKFVGIRCTPKGETSATDIPLHRLSQIKGGPHPYRCAPLKSVALLFSSPVLNSMVKNHIAFDPPLDGGRKDYDPWANSGDWTRLSSPHRSGRTYQVWLPELLKAFQEYSVTIDREKLKDEFGRQLPEDIALSFMTSHREPQLTLVHRNAVLEKSVDSDVPLYVTNIDSVTANYQKLGDANSETGLRRKFEISKAEDIAYRFPLGARELLGDDSGAIFGSLHPDPVPPGYWYDPEFFVQVTPYQVHAKFGHFNSQVWVTDFASGNPVASAKVTLYKGSYSELSKLRSEGISASTNSDGIAELPGIAKLDPQLETFRYYLSQGSPRYFIKVEHKGDISILPLDNQFMVRSSGASNQIQRRDGHSHAWGTTAQGIYKLGDTAQYKIYVRDQSNKHWVSPKKQRYSLTVTDPQGKTVHEVKELVLNAFGAFDGSFPIPEQGAVGWYTFTLTRSETVNGNAVSQSWRPMTVLVSDFTPAPFKVKTGLNGELFKAKDKVVVNALATLHSGGPFTEAEIRLTARLQAKAFVTNDPRARGFLFGSNLSNQQSNLLNVRGKLNDRGEYENMFTLPETDIYFGSILVESAVRDDRGKFVAATATADYAGRDRFVGLKNTNWLYKQGEKSAIETIVVDKSGKPVAGSDVSIQIRRQEFKVSRVKGPGNAYLTQNILTWVDDGSCNIKTEKAASRCEFVPGKPGSYQFIATVKDSLGREHRSTMGGWVVGRGRVVWNMSNDSTLEIIPEQTSYKIGEKARFLVKNPFPGAKALISVERYGVLDSWVQTLDSSTPVIEVPVKPDYLPGFYLSVMAISPRVDKPLGEGHVDLGKPSYRMGYVAANVTDPFKEIAIDVSTDRQVYKPRDKVKARIHIKGARASSGNDRYEIAVAVVDESVLALNARGERYYDPYRGFNRLDPLDLNNYSLISRLVGRQKFEKKGANPGGDGGGTAYSQLRNMFKFVSYWNPSLTPDKEGFANVEFEVPDNLTGWRLLAFAVTADDKMGLGRSSMKVNRPTELRPVMPNQVTEGDSFKAGFSVMNRTDKSRRLSMKVRVDGPLAEKSQREFAYEVDVAPFKRKSVWVPINTKKYGNLTFTARAADASDGDAVEHKLKIGKRRSLETAANYGTFTSGSAKESIKVPEGIYPDVGSISAVLSPTVVGNLEGAFRYLRDYPYLCWEQRLTKAVMASSFIELKKYFRKEVEWPNPEHDIERTLKSAVNFQAPNGGMTYWTASNEHVSPYLSAYTAMAFNWLRRDGHAVPAEVEEKLHRYLLNQLRNNVFPSFFSEGMSSTVRSVAMAALSESGKITTHDIMRYAEHFPEMDLFGKAHFVTSAINAGVSEGKTKELLDAILAHASQSGGKFQFSEPWDDSYKYILATPLRSNCAILSTMLTAQTKAAGNPAINDVPFKLVRSITQSRGQRDFWENTQENVFCANAIISYSKLYEAEKPAMDVEVRVADEKIGSARFASLADPAVTLARDLQAKDIGKHYDLEIAKSGKGRLYYAARLSYDLKQDNTSRINAGIEARREYSVERDGKFVIIDSPMKIKRGELVRVDIFVSVPAPRHFVVVNDPVPGGLEPVNTDLATSSTIDAQKGAFKASEGSWWFKFSDWSYYGRYFWSFYHKELRHDSARFYADYLPAGNYHLSYTAQAIAEGNFTVMPLHVEEMYDPDVYGKGLPATLEVSGAAQ